MTSQFALRPIQLRTKAASLNLPHWLNGCRDKILASRANLQVHFGLANFPVAYCGLKIITSQAPFP